MKTLKLFFLIFVLLITSSKNGFTQFGNVWTFGNGYGIDFNSGQPVQTQVNSMYSAEGCASICDSTGQLLFYTNGETIWNYQNIQMPNGDSIGGDQSSTQSSIIIPFQPKKYLVFTTDRENGNKGLRYSIVDMDLNGGLGDVVLKSQFLEDSLCEKLAATRHCNGIDWWVVARKSNSDNFVSFAVTSSGVNSTPVISNSGTPLYNLGGFNPNSIKYGQMKFSTNGKLLGLAYRSVCIELLEFDNLTGMVLNTKFRDYNIPDLDAYGLSFTSDGLYLFSGNRITGSSPNSGISIARYRIFPLIQDSIADSKLIIQVNDNLLTNADSINLIRSFQLGPDGFIYGIGLVADTLLSVNRLQLFRVGNSSVIGSMSTIERLPFYFVPGTIIGSGLPNTYDGIYTNHHKASLRLPLCNSPFPFDSIPFFDSLLTVTRDYSWDFGDPTSGTNNFSNLQHPIHQYSSTGTYTVTLTLESDCNPIVVSQQVVVTQVPPPVPLLSMNMGHLESSPADSYQWYFEGSPITGAVFQQYFPTQTGNYTVQVSNPSGCTATSLPFNVTAVQLKELQNFPKFSMLQIDHQITLSSNPLTDCFQCLELIDLQGRVLQTYAYQQKQNKVEINISDLQSGLYLLRVNGREVRRVVKE